MFRWPRKSRLTFGPSRTRRYWWLCLVDFWNFFTIYVFEVSESFDDIPTELPCLGDLKNSGHFLVHEVFEVTQTFVPWQKSSKFISSRAKVAGRSHNQRFKDNFIVMSRHVTSYHIMPRHVTSCHVISHPVASLSVTPCHVMPRHVTSCHVKSHHATSCHIMPRHATSCHVMSHHVTSCHVMSRHVTSCHVMSLPPATSCHVMSRHFTSFHVMSRHVTSCHVMSRHVTSCHVMSRHVTSCHVVSRHATLRPVTSCHVMSRPVTSCHVGCPEGCRNNTASAVYNLVFSSSERIHSAARPPRSRGLRGLRGLRGPRYATNQRIEPIQRESPVNANCQRTPPPHTTYY